MRGRGFENMATVLVDPAVLDILELELMAIDLRVWPVHTAPTFADPVRLAMQLRRSLVDRSNGRWKVAENWVVIWITFGDGWLDGDEPIPWPAHATLWNKLSEYADHVRYSKGLSGMPRIGVARGLP